VISNPRHAKIDSEAPQSVVYFDGSCPLCRAEIGYYRRSDVAEALCFVDVSKTNVELDNRLNAQQAMQRFHVRTREGKLLSGAAAFVEVWSRLPNWKWVAQVAALPGAVSILEICYEMFLPVRPLISRLFAKIH
jgi:predicted DCC family thiol-disulfide oxidoreductase YuxK